MWPFNKQNESCRETVQPGGVLREAADPRNEAIDYIHRENVDCKTCGCLIRKVNAIAGEDYIESRLDVNVNLNRLSFYYGEPIPMEKTIVTPYYCKRCAPKTKKVSKSR